MATYTGALRKGSKGDEVKKLQQALVSAGYDIGSSGVDGSYGPATQAAITKYQQDNGLTVDGVAGRQTQGALFGNTPTTNNSTPTTSTNTPTAAQPTTTAPAQTKPSTPSATNPKYTYDAASDAAYQQALAALQQASKAVPTYAGTYDTQLEELYNKIVNREQFKYDVNGDALYQQYAQQYSQNGKMAMLDTIGQASAMTGGYGNSYATTAGNQAYNAYMQDLNAVIPELYGMALDRYNEEGDQLMQEYAMLGDMADDEYGKYMDSLNQYWQNVSYLKDEADNAYNRGRDNWYTAQQLEIDADERAYQRGLDDYTKQENAYEKLANLITSTGHTPTAEELKAAGMSAGEAQSYANYYKNQQSKGNNSGGVDDTGNPGGGYNNGSLKPEQVKELQAALGVTADGLYGANSQNAAGGLSAEEAYQKYVVEGGGLETEDDYADWNAGDWEGYFATIRNSEGKSAAEEELTRMTKAGLIPQKMLSYAAIGARGSLGH